MKDQEAWLHACIDEDERLARLATPGPWASGRPYEHAGSVDSADGNIANESSTGSVDPVDADHIARHDPARVLAEVAAKRELLAVVAGDPFDAMGAESAYELLVIQHLSLAYAGRPGYRDEWRPSS